MRSIVKPMTAAMKPRIALRVIAPWNAFMNASCPAASTFSRSGPAAWATASRPPALMPCEAVSAASAPSCFPAAEDVKSWVTVCWKNAPIPAMPTAMPTCWKVSLMPDATPDLAGSVTPMARGPRGPG